MNSSPVMIFGIYDPHLNTSAFKCPIADCCCHGRCEQGECRALLLVVTVGVESIKILKPKCGFIEGLLETLTPSLHLLPNAIEEEPLVCLNKVGHLFKFPQSTERSSMEDVSPENAGYETGLCNIQLKL